MPVSADITQDLNATITHAVNARIEAEISKAFASDEFLAAYVRAALQQPIEVRTDSYSREKKPFLNHVLTESIREATKVAVAKWLHQNAPFIEAEVEKALRRETKGIAAGLVESLTKVADKAYGVDVKIDLKMPNSG